MRVLAVDGGQSTIRVGYSDGRPPVELAGVSHQEGDTVASVADAAVAGWQALGAPTAERAILGLTTAPAGEPERDRLCARVGTATRTPSVWLADDAVTAHAGALTLGWGVAVTVGTGVACLARAREGLPVILGGHGYLLGDEGGAFWIGATGLRAALRADDGRGEATILRDLAAARFGGLEGLGARLHAAQRPVDAIARFAPDVVAAAAAGDAVASAILGRATDELLVLVRSAVARAGDEAVVPVALGGRLLESGALRDRLMDAIATSLPSAAPRPADGSPLDGGLLLGAAPEPGAYASLVHVWGIAA